MQSLFYLFLLHIDKECAYIQPVRDPRSICVAMTHIIRATLLFCQIFLGYDDLWLRVMSYNEYNQCPADQAYTVF